MYDAKTRPRKIEPDTPLDDELYIKFLTSRSSTLSFIEKVEKQVRVASSTWTGRMKMMTGGKGAR